MNRTRVALDIAQGEESWGQITLELDAEKAPQTVENFLKYVDAGFYDDTIFHRVIASFMIQGGGFTADHKAKRAGLLPPVQNEAANGLKNKKLTIAMARTSDPHSATSQFFISTANNGFLDYPGQDGWGYCVFGRVVGGEDVVQRIAGVKTRPNPQMGGESSQPVDPPRILRAARA